MRLAASWVFLIVIALAPAGGSQQVGGRSPLAPADPFPVVRIDPILGEVQGDHFGWMVAPGGDPNGDGVPDLLVGAPSADNLTAVMAGRCYLFHGPIAGPLAAADAAAIFVGESFGDQLSTTAAIDANDDGVSDVMLGAPSHDQPVLGAGRVYIFHGPVSGVLEARRADAIISGADDFDGAGARLATGDLNGDGIDDAILGCPGAAVSGSVFVMFGPLHGRQQSVAGAGAVVTPALPFENLGASVAAADLDGDGQDDLIVGGPASPIGQTPPGRVYVFFGPVAGTMPAWSADLILQGDGANDALGASVAAGDFTGDGISDLLVGADQFFFTPGTGQAYLFSGPLQPGFHNAGSADAIFLGQAPRDQLGKSVSCAGDVDADGFEDALIGAPGFGGADAGRAYLFFGPFSGQLDAADADLRITGGPLDWLGWSLAGVGDVDGNGIPDLAVGAPAHPVSASGGTVMVVRLVP